MLIDEPDLTNDERLHLAADELLKGRTVIVYMHPRGVAPECYPNWLTQILRERGRRDGFSEETAEILAGGATFEIERLT